MSLNSEQMLPARVRKMRQMEDLLNVEDIILAEIERIIDEMYGAAALLHEELVNEAWLKENWMPEQELIHSRGRCGQAPGNDNAGCKQNCGC